MALDEAGEAELSIGSFVNNGIALVTNYDLSGVTTAQTVSVAKKAVSAYAWTMSDGTTNDAAAPFTQEYNRRTWTMTATSAAGRAYDTITAADGYVFDGDEIAVNGTTNAALLSGNTGFNAGSYTASILAGNAADDANYTVSDTVTVCVASRDTLLIIR